MKDGGNTYPMLDHIVSTLHSRREEWAQLGTSARIALLEQVRARVADAAERWVALSSKAKDITPDSPLEGEEWTSGPWALLATCDHVLATLRAIAADGKPAIGKLKKRSLGNGQLAVEVFPHSIFDRLLLSGVRSEVWMEPGVTESNLAQHTAKAYRTGVKPELGLVLGAGNIASIAPLDAVYKMFTEKAVCIVKLNPVNDYLLPVFEYIFQPLIDRQYLHFVPGGGDVGAWLCNHALVESIHITGSQETHDRIVYGDGEQGAANRASQRPINPRPISSELGAVCPTIVVPGPWTAADVRFQASHIATQKLHNSGFNCVACQVLVLPEGWQHTEALRAAVRDSLANAPDRKPYYPGAQIRQEDMQHQQGNVNRVSAAGMQAQRHMVTLPAPGQGADYARRTEVFAPTLCEQLLPGGDAEDFLRRAIAFANTGLRGTLGANIIIHPATIRALGSKWDELLQELKYGTIAINAWTGLGYLLTQNPWGAFPGHELHDVQSGIGSVHNTYMFDKPQRTVVQAPFRPFPRTLLHGGMTLLPKPPWFVNNRRAHRIGKKLFAFQVRPSWFKLPGIFLDALRG